MILGICLYCKNDFRKREKKYKFCSLICSSNYNKNGLKKIQIPEPSNSLAEFIGICLGDGYISRYQTAITLNSIADKDYIAYVIKLIRFLFPAANISIVKKTKDNATDVRINSIQISEFLMNSGLVPKNKKIPAWISLNDDYSRACTRGLFDTEGSISFKIYSSKKGISVYKQLNFRNIDKDLMLFVRNVLLCMGLKPTMTLTKSLYLSNNLAIDTYRKYIGFGNPKLYSRSLIYTSDDYENWKHEKLLTQLSSVVYS